MFDGSTASAACAGTTADTSYSRGMQSFYDNCDNIAPTFVRTDLHEAYFIDDHGVMYAAWISPAGNPTATSLTVDADTASVPMQINLVAYRKRDTSPRYEFRRFLIDSNVNSLDNTQITVTYPPNDDQYKIIPPVPFTLPLNPAITDDTVYNLTTTQKAVNRNTDGSYTCVDMGGGDPNAGDIVAGYANYNECTLGNASFPILIRVRSAFTTAGTTNMYADTGAGFTLRATNGNTTPTIAGGSTVYWGHTLNVNGTVKNQSFTIDHNRSRTGPGAFATTTADTAWTFGAAGTTLISPTPALTRAINGINTAGVPYVAPSNAVGSTFCERLNWTPISRANGSLNNTVASSPYTCFTVGANYELEPIANATYGTIQAGQTISFNYQVDNAGPTQSNSTTVEVREFIVASGVPIPSFANRNDLNCAAYGPSCTERTVSVGTVFPLNNTGVADAPSSAVSTAGLAAGTSVCRVLVVDSRDESVGPRTRDSIPACTMITRAPKVSIVGGDASAGNTGATAGFSGYSQQSNFGSNGEYGLFATGAISDFTSAGKIYTTTPLAGTMPLAFANNINTTIVPGSTSATGYYMAAHTMTDLITKYQTRGLAGANTYTGGGIPSTGDYLVTSDINITLSNLPAGRRVLIYAPGRTVTIDDNITYTTTGLGSFADAPMLVVIARNILVDESVTRLDGVFAATDAFTTCLQAGLHPTDPLVSPATGNAALAAGASCDIETFIVNGAVIARRVLLPRTAGGNNAAEGPAEIFRLRPEAFLTPQLIFNSNTPLTTINETELPARN